MSTLLRFSAVIVALTLVACGGGGSDKKPAPGSSVSSSSPASSLASSSISNSSNSVALSSSLSSSAASAIVSVKLNGTISGFDTKGASVQLDPNHVVIEVRLLDQQDNALDQVNAVASNYNLSEQLRFNADLSAVNAVGLAVAISYPGYTTYARRLDAMGIINLDAKLQAVPVQTVVPGIATSVTGIELPGFNVQISGDDEQQSNHLLINIPQSLLPDDTDSLEVAVRTFDPNNMNDAEFFPGAYADSDGNDLASVGFNFADIKTNTNDNLAVAMQKKRQQQLASVDGVQKALSQEPVMIEYQIPAQSCRLLESLGDADVNEDGFQVPFYTFDPATGVWDLIGMGTLYDSSGQEVPAAKSEFACDTNSFYLITLVSNAVFQREWWNLDYPVAFSQPIDYCANIQLKNPEGKTLAGINGLVADNDADYNFASTFFTTDSNGVANLRISQSSINPDLQAEVIFYNQDELTYAVKSIRLSNNCDDSSIQVLELVRPQLCEVNGQFFYESGAPVTRNLVYGFSPMNEENESPIWAFDFAYSNTEGSYRLNLPCGGEYEIFNVASQLAQTTQPEMAKQLTRIDGNLDPDEQSDNGNEVVMKTLEIAHHQPLMTGMYDTATNQLVIAAYGTFDAFPMSAQVVIKNLDQSVIYQTFTGTLQAAGENDDDAMGIFFKGELTRTLELPATAEDGYWMEVNIEDSLGKTWAAVPGVIGVFPSNTN